MSSKSSNRICVCDLALRALALCFSKATTVSGCDVCSTCRHKAMNELTKKKIGKK